MFFGKEKDPVCGMKVNKDTKHQNDYKSKRYYFCSLNCKQSFDKNPGRYAK